MSFLVLHNMSNFILKVFQCLLDWKELAPEIQGLSSTYYNNIFKHFKGLEFFF